MSEECREDFLEKVSSKSRLSVETKKSQVKCQAKGIASAKLGGERERRPVWLGFRKARRRNTR